MPWLSLVPAGTTILITFKTKKLIPALLAGIFIGTLLHERSFFAGVLSIGDFIIDAFIDRESAYTLGFLIAFGALADLIEMAGGITGFSQRVEKYVQSEKAVFGWAWYLSLLTFFDSSFHTIAVGTVLRPLLEKVNGSKEKLAFILSVTSLQLILLIPIATSYLGFMISLVAINIKGRGFAESAYAIFFKSIAWNFFSWTMIMIAIGVTLFGLGFGQYKLGSESDEDELTEAHIEKEKLSAEAIEEYPRKSRNLAVPIIFLLTTTVFLFWWTGRAETDSIVNAFFAADFSKVIFTGVLLTIIFASIYYLMQKISLAEIEEHIISGGQNVFSLILILVLSWALIGITEALGFNDLISGGILNKIPVALLPSILFLLSGLISYTLGSSWATWALMMPVAINFSVSAKISVALLVGTVWAGGAVTDVISPLSAEMINTSFGKHLVTSLPYVLAGAGISLLGYIIAGILM